jgi:dTDP-D-glucose 4,6-dehydratase
MIIADELKDTLRRTREGLLRNFDPRDPAFVSLREELERLFKKKNLSEITQEDMQANITALNDIHGTFNAGYGGQITIQDLAEKIISEAGSSSKIVHLPERAGDVRHSRASSDKLRAAGWVPQFSLEEGLAQTMEYFRSVTA